MTKIDWTKDDRRRRSYRRDEYEDGIGEEDKDLHSQSSKSQRARLASLACDGRLDADFRVVLEVAARDDKLTRQRAWTLIRAAKNRMKGDEKTD